MKRTSLQPLRNPSLTGLPHFGQCLPSFRLTLTDCSPMSNQTSLDPAGNAASSLVVRSFALTRGDDMHGSPTNPKNS
eukprot:4103651-Amphidinium_carterae.1